MKLLIPPYWTSYDFFQKKLTWVLNLLWEKKILSCWGFLNLLEASYIFQYLKSVDKKIWIRIMKILKPPRPLIKMLVTIDDPSILHNKRKLGNERKLGKSTSHVTTPFSSQIHFSKMCYVKFHQLKLILCLVTYLWNPQY